MKPFRTYAEMNEGERKALRERLEDFRIRKTGRKAFRRRKYTKRRLQQLEAKRWVWKQLGNKCENCGESDESTFDIHHDNESPKSNHARRKEIQKWYEEQKIPEGAHLFCANCHRKFKHPLIRGEDLK